VCEWHECVKWLECRSSDNDSKQGEIKRQLVELEREIGLTMPLIAELDGRLTSHSSIMEKAQSSKSPTVEASSSAEPTVKTVEVDSSSSAKVEKVAAGVDMGLQRESSASSNRTLQVCWKLPLTLSEACMLLRSVTFNWIESSYMRSHQPLN